MSRTILGMVVGLLMAATARAEVVVELVPDNPGPYHGGEALTVDVWLHSEVDYWASFRHVQFDFILTDPHISLDTTFTFDYTTLHQPHGYDYGSPALPVPWMYNGWDVGCVPACPEVFLAIPPRGSLHIGSIGMRLPTQEGVFRLDAIYGFDPDPERGARFMLANSPFWPDPVWRSHTGEITVGTCDFTVTAPPVPAVSGWGLVSMGLLTLTGVTLLVRRNGIGRTHTCLHASRDEPCRRRSFPTTRRTERSPVISIVFLLAVPGGLPDLRADLPSEIVEINLDSGDVSASGGGSEPVVVFSEVVTVADAVWMRLHFAQVVLSGSPATGDESFLRLISQLDGASQILNLSGLDTWSNTSAYFNGDAMLVDLLAFPNTGVNRVVIDIAAVGIDGSGGEAGRFPCGEDDRVPSSDPRAGRVRITFPSCGFTVGSAFLFNNQPNGLLTAGHVCNLLELDPGCGFVHVLQFNVPPSTPGGLIQDPPACDQYPIDEDSIWNGLTPGVGGGEWCFFGVKNVCAENHPPGGHSPLAKQGTSYRLADGVPGADGSTLRVTGYGKATGTRNYAEQTGTGPYVSEDEAGNLLWYTVDTALGSSGSAVEHISGLVFAIHFDAYCHTALGVNEGKSVDTPELRDALTPYVIDGESLEPKGAAADCNGNGIPDWCDVGCVYEYGQCYGYLSCGGFGDCNGNLVPDECEPQVGGNGDCNANGIQDICDIAAGTVPDCNVNSVPDECDLSTGFSLDCNANGVPDTCDIAAGIEDDCNNSAIPDNCELERDCDGNGVPDECEYASGACCVGQSCTLIVETCCARQGGTFGEPGTVCTGDCDANGLDDGCEHPFGVCCFVVGAFCEVATESCCTAEPGYLFSGGYTACDDDCNANMIADACDLLQGTSADCNENAVPDECDIAGGSSEDCTGNGIPDECEPDCNNNGVADSCDIATDPSLDCYNTNGIPDSCEYLPRGGCCWATGFPECVDHVTNCWCTGHGGLYAGNGSRCTWRTCLIFAPQP